MIKHGELTILLQVALSSFLTWTMTPFLSSLFDLAGLLLMLYCNQAIRRVRATFSNWVLLVEIAGVACHTQLIGSMLPNLTSAGLIVSASTLVWAQAEPVHPL